MQKNIYLINSLTNMEKTEIFTVVTIASLLIALVATISLMTKVNALYEDQFIVCNFKKVCIEIDIDDYMSTHNSNIIWSLMQNNIDTFNTGDIE
jgi:hypothetical protein